MIDFISTLFNVGDTIYLVQNDGIEVGGTILNLNDDFIVIETAEDNVIGLRKEIINSFSKKPVKSSNNTHTAPTNNPSTYKRVASTATLNPHKQGGDTSYGGAVSTPNRNKSEFKQYKPGDKIPLESLTERDPALAVTWRRMEQDRKRVQEMRESIQKVLDEVKQEGDDLDLVVPALGVIVDLKPSYKFGFIDDAETGDRYFYNKGDIIDRGLMDMVGEGVKVVYHRSINHKGPAAKCIHRPDTIGNILDIVMSLVIDNDLVRAKMVLQNILVAYPDSTSTKKMLDVIDCQMDTDKGGGDVLKNDNLYSQARYSFEKKNYHKALQLYQECIDKGIRKVNSIKELVQVYISLFLQEKDEEQKEYYRLKGLEFIDTHKDELPDNTSTLFSLENLYFALGDYEKHIDVVEDIISECGANGDLAQYVFYLNKAAQSYLRLNDLDRALDAANQGLEVEENNVHLLKTKSTIEEALSQR